MAKKANNKNNKKQSKKDEKKVIDTNIKEAFISEAQNTVFTEEDVKELAVKEEEPVVEEPVVNEEPEETEVAAEEENYMGNVQFLDSVVDEGVSTKAKYGSVIEESDLDEKLNDIPVDETVNDEVVQEEPKKDKPKRRRTTSKEAYGYHWMGLVYDE